MPGGSQRVIHPELLEDAPAAIAALNLADMRRINRWFGGRRVLGNLFSGLVLPAEEFSVLDVGAASGDAGVYLQGRYSRVRVVSLDARRDHLELAPPSRVVADAFRPPFAGRSFDIVLCANLLHHFPDETAAALLAALYALCRRALVVIDLERHWLASRFLPATRAVLRWSPLTVYDGPVSVRAAFRDAELRDLAVSAGLPRASVRRHLPWFRLSLVARR